MLRAVKIRMEYLEQPVGLGALPRFGWVLESDRKNVVQKAYRLQIAKDPQFESLVYDSGLVESAESAYVEVPSYREAMPDGQGQESGRQGQESTGCRVDNASQECGRHGENDINSFREKLCSCTEYFVRVRVSDGVEESSYSETASFVTGILGQEEWQAEFITAEREADSGKSGSTCLKKQIRLDGKVASAYACATAFGLYRFFINGKKVGEDELMPGWTSYHKHLCCQTYDVTALLKEGENRLDAMLGAGWYKGKMGFLLLRNNYGTRTAFLMQLTVRYEDGREEVFVTDESWQGRPGPVTFSEIYDGEHYDARLEREISFGSMDGRRADIQKGAMGGTELPGVGRADAAREEALTGKSEAAMHLSADEVNTEKGTVRSELWGMSRGALCTEGKDTVRAWHPVQILPFPKASLTAQAGCKVRKMERLQAREALVTPKGETVIDFAQNLTGWVNFRVQAEPGSEILLKCFETLDARGNVYTANLRSARQEIHYICKGGLEQRKVPVCSIWEYSAYAEKASALTSPGHFSTCTYRKPM